MRRGSLTLLVGVIPIVAGVAQLWYYATVTYPGEEAQSRSWCDAQRAPCATLAPASDQGAYVLGEFAAGVGVVLGFLGGVRFLWATVRPPPRRRSLRQPERTERSPVV
ncbi:MAG: hypothetical protein L3K18_05925 [Thermoplasmata archaeon]|nr:hypothetical protein [Thermoplasmata archaeon]